MEIETILKTNIKDASYEIEALVKLKEAISSFTCDLEFQRKLERQIEQKIEEVEDLKSVYISDLKRK
jgi:hypothetical protein